MSGTREEKTPIGGIYVLLIQLDEGQDIEVGALGEITFDAGAYAYVGSAKNGIQQRVQRHLSDDKQLHWHVDYLLQHASVADAVSLETDQDIECEVARRLSERLRAIPEFGSSDCDCCSHLFYCPDLVQLRGHVNEAVSSSTT